MIITGLMFFNTGFSQEGNALFQTHCTACHTIGGGRRVGPDLINILDKRSLEWTVSFIRSSQTMINSGDPEAMAIFKEYNKILMPDPPLTDNQTRSVVEYISQLGKMILSGDTTSFSIKPEPDLLAETSPENIRKGLLMFTGKKRLTNHGPSCGACHKVRDDRVFTSGVLAKELTQSFEIMGSAGVAAILRNPPFPVMTAAYAKYPLTEDEVIDLTAYLKSVSDERVYQHPRDYSMLFGIAGVFFFFVSLAGTYIFYAGRKKLAVNHRILSRHSRTIN